MPFPAKYSRIIEEANEVPNEMMWQMTRDYCAYVRRYSLKEYSPAVQKVMNYVNLNVAEPLTLKSLAAMCFISHRTCRRCSSRRPAAP